MPRMNTGVSTIRALKPAVEILAKDGITLTFTGNGIDPSGKMGNVVVLNAR